MFMTIKPATLPDDPSRLKEMLRRAEKEIDLLREENRLLYARLFGKKSEKNGVESAGVQIPLFDMPEPDPEPVHEQVEVEKHTRPKSGRKKLAEHLPRVEVVHDIAETEKVCGCGAELSRIGEDISEKLEIIPAVIRVIKHVRPKYACKQCEGVDTEGNTVKIAPPPRQIIAKGIATAGLLAHILTAKFCDALPFYRQERQFERLGVTIGRSTMCNWAMKAAKACEPLLALLVKEIRSGPLINIDETTVQVLQEPGRPPTSGSYMWVCRGGPPEQPALLYHYAPSRSGNVARELLKDYKGLVQSDGYSGYDFLDTERNIIHGGCWAHARRKFMEVQKAHGKGKKPGSAEVALSYIQKIYAAESEARRKNYTGSQLVELRLRKSKPVLDDFFNWLSKKVLQVPPKSLLGKAVNYTLNQWQRLLVYLDHAVMTPDNNLAENAIRPFVVGRKNWIFAGTVEGVRASSCLYSLVETAKANGLEPYSYLRYIFEKLPFAETGADFARLLPAVLNKDDLLVEYPLTGV